MSKFSEIYTVSRCNLCAAKFGIQKPQHRCKRCDQRVCEECGRKNRIIPGYKDQKPHRVCNVCEEDMKFQLKLTAFSKIAWNTNSEIGLGWVAKLKDLDEVTKKAVYEEYIQISKELNPMDPNNVLIQKDILSGRTDQQVFGYSMKEFLYQVQGETATEKSRANVANVCIAFCIRNPEIGYVQGMNLIVCFLLMFLQEENAFWVFTYLIERVLPPSFYSQAESGMNLIGFYTECRALLTIFPKIFYMKDPQQINTLASFMEIVLPSLLLPLFVNTLNFEVVYYIISQLLETCDWLFLEKCTLAIFESIKDTVLEDEFLALKDYRLLISKRVNSHYLSDRIQTYNLTSDIVTKLKENFAQEHKEEWNHETNMTYEALAKITKFSKEEIEEMQKKFNNLSESHEISLPAFLELIEEIIDEKESFPSKESHKKIFEYFDRNKDASVGFKEFLCSASLLLRGNIPDKIHFCLKINDHESKGYLAGAEFESFLELVIQMAFTFHDGSEGLNFEAESVKFKQQANEILSTVQRFRPNHVQEILQTGFVGKLQKCYVRRNRKENMTQNNTKEVLRKASEEYHSNVHDKILLLNKQNQEDIEKQSQLDNHNHMFFHDLEEISSVSNEGNEKRNSCTRTRATNSTASKEDLDSRNTPNTLTSDHEYQLADNQEESLIQAPIFTQMNPTSEQYQTHQKQAKPMRAVPAQPDSCKLCRIF